MTRVPLKTKRVALRLTPEQCRIIEQRAARCNVSASAWMRSILAQAASRPSKDGFLRIHEPDGATI